MVRWKPVVGYENKYTVSDDGIVINRWGKELKGSIAHNGYRYVTLSNGGIKNHKIHRLVANAFLPNHGNKPEVNHKDGNKLNNNVTNLEWSTRLENAHHAIKVLGINFGEWNNKTHCKRGHDFSITRVYLNDIRTSTCSICRRDYQREYQRRRNGYYQRNAQKIGVEE